MPPVVFCTPAIHGENLCYKNPDQSQFLATNGNSKHETENVTDERDKLSRNISGKEKTILL